MSGRGRHIAAGVMMLALWSGPMQAGATGISCVAQSQCRGDAERMCAPSGLRIEAARRGPHVDMWIDRQSPYVARMRGAAGEVRLDLPLFDGHGLSVARDGRFIYLGNRGKRYSGTCEGAL